MTPKTHLSVNALRRMYWHQLGKNPYLTPDDFRIWAGYRMCDWTLNAVELFTFGEEHIPTCEHCAMFRELVLIELNK